MWQNTAAPYLFGETAASLYHKKLKIPIIIIHDLFIDNMNILCTFVVIYVNYEDGIQIPCHSAAIKNCQRTEGRYLEIVQNNDFSENFQNTLDFSCKVGKIELALKDREC